LLIDVAQWLDLWRRCCPFYEFQIDYHAADGSLWLSVKGRPGVKEYIPVDSPRLASKLARWIDTRSSLLGALLAVPMLTFVRFAGCWPDRCRRTRGIARRC
jgi:hypothetical protein